MKFKLLKEIVEKKKNKIEFSIITNLNSGQSCIFEKNQPIDKNFENYKDKINLLFEKKINGIIENTDIFIENYIRPIRVFIVGAVHILHLNKDFQE